MKTSRLKAGIAGLLCFAALPAYALNKFECLRDLMSITGRGNFLSKRKGVESPILIQKKFIVFPEIEGRRVKGFFVYDKTGAWHFDSVAYKGNTRIKDLSYETSAGVFKLVAQPAGIETFSVDYLPGFDPNETEQEGPVILGSSVLPVVGAMISRPARQRLAYYNPATAYQSDLRRWMFNHATGRRPATEKEMDVKRTMVKLVASNRGDVWGPLESELKLRREWIQTHNLDQASFREFNRIMEGSCKPALAPGP